MILILILVLVLIYAFSDDDAIIKLDYRSLGAIIIIIVLFKALKQIKQSCL